MSKEKIILLVDDDADDREIFCDAVQRVDSSIKCITANDGEEALAFLKNPKSVAPGIIFLDLNMPRVDGKKCLEEIKKVGYLGHIPIIIYTTSQSKADKEESIRNGAVHFVTKPSSFESICNEITLVLDKWGFHNTNVG